MALSSSCRAPSKILLFPKAILGAAFCHDVALRYPPCFSTGDLDGFSLMAYIRAKSNASSVTRGGYFASPCFLRPRRQCLRV